MQTFLYNLNKREREGIIREGRYLVDGQPGILPDFLVELVIEKHPDPPYDYTSQTIEYRSFADLENLKWIEESYVRDLSQEEINQRKPVPLDCCDPKQFRFALIKTGISISSIDQIIDSIEDPIEKELIKTEWEYTFNIEKNDVLIKLIADKLNLTHQQIDNLFSLANSFKL